MRTRTRTMALFGVALVALSGVVVAPRTGPGGWLLGRLLLGPRPGGNRLWRGRGDRGFRADVGYLRLLRGVALVADMQGKLGAASRCIWHE
ncbi:hypothetical protein [Micromonospora sp. NPDC049102]|uniref:hypothetical protein n=1 Tax=Micromonospora sp. NPDC049102 TaxID=3364265 RepID=UPI0037103948